MSIDRWAEGEGIKPTPPDTTELLAGIEHLVVDALRRYTQVDVRRWLAEEHRIEVGASSFARWWHDRRADVQTDRRMEDGDPEAS